MDMPFSVTIFEQCKVAPPANSVPKTTIPLTFFDMPWISLQVERILFYDFPHPTLHFVEEILPSLKHSLSLSLQHYFPLAGSLVCPPLPLAPHILYQDGDSIPLIIAKSNDDFSSMVKNCPRDALKFRPLVPELSNETIFLTRDTDKVPITIIRPLIALQVTIFPNSGISICLAYQHVVGDGRTLNNFIKSWASISKSKNHLADLIMQPCHNRPEVIKDPNNKLLDLICDQMYKFGITWEEKVAPVPLAIQLQEKLHATFVLNRREIDKLRDKITLQFKKMDEKMPLSYISTFVVTYAFIWVCMKKAENETESLNNDFMCYGIFAADCTERKELHVPKNYLGNCLTYCAVSIMKNELLGQNGLLLAAKALMKEIKGLENGYLDKMETWIPECSQMYFSGHLLSVAGSPKLCVYETDFGWAKPRKSEVVHIYKSSGSISIAEIRDEEGGVEVGLALNKVCMDAFISIFEIGLKNDLC